MPRLRFLSGAIVAALVFGSTAQAARFDKVVVFGDSLSDNGNISLSQGATTATRFTTNPGEVALEHVADALGRPLTPSISGGTDFAWGGAGVNDNAPDTPAGVPTVTDQVNAYLGARTPDPQALYAVWGGANDIFHHATVSILGVETRDQAQSAIATAGSDEVTLIGKLQAAGANNIVVFNLPDIGITPKAGATDALVPGSAQYLSTLSSTFNTQLNAGLAQLDTGIIPVNAHAFLNEVAADPARYGFSNITDAACGAGSSAVQCGPAGSGATYTYPAGADHTYLFADGVHPSSAAHAILGQLVVSELQAPGQISMLAEAPLAAAHAQTRVLYGEMDRDTLDRGSRVFVSAGYGRQRFDATADSPKTASGNTHVTLGVDGQVANTLSVGVALGLGRSNADFSGNSGGYRMRNLMLNGYAMAHLGGAWAGVYAGGGRIRFHDIERRFALGPALRTESGDTDASQLQAGVRGGFMFGGGRHVRTGPFVDVQWHRVRVDGYSEDSGDSSAMRFASQTRHALIESLGWRFSGRWRVGDSTLQPYLDLALHHDSQADAHRVTAGLTTMAGRFRLDGYTPDANWGSAALGISAHYNNITGWFGYTGRLADRNQTLNALNIGVDIGF